MPYDLKALEEERNRRKQELDLLDQRKEQLELLELSIQCITPDLERLAELTRRHPRVLGQGLVLFGRQMPDPLEEQAAYTELQIIPVTTGWTPLLRKAEKQLAASKTCEPARRRRHRGALRQVIIAIGDEILHTPGNRGQGDCTTRVTSQKLRSRADLKPLLAKTFGSTITRCARERFISWCGDGTETFTMGKLGWNRFAIYNAQPHHLCLSSIPEAEKADPNSPPEPAPEPKAPEPAKPVAKDAIMGLLPATVEELQETLASAGYDPSSMRACMREMIDENLIHLDNGRTWQIGPRNDAVAHVPEKPSDPPKTDDSWVGVDRMKVILAIGDNGGRQAEDVRKQVHLDHQLWGDAIRFLDRHKLLKQTSNHNGKVMLTDLGKAMASRYRAQMKATA